jgi:ankyrin repeat protein
VNAKDRFGWTPLIKAAMFGYNDIVKILLDRGADVNAKTGLGCTALIEAAKIGHVRTVRILLDNNADMNLTDKDGNTAMREAVMGENLEVIALLSKAKDSPSTIRTKDSVGFVQKVGNEKTEMNEKNKDSHNGKHLYFFGFLK